MFQLFTLSLISVENYTVYPKLVIFLWETFFIISILLPIRVVLEKLFLHFLPYKEIWELTTVFFSPFMYFIINKQFEFQIVCCDLEGCQIRKLYGKDFMQKKKAYIFLAKENFFNFMELFESNRGKERIMFNQVGQDIESIFPSFILLCR